MKTYFYAAGICAYLAALSLLVLLHIMPKPKATARADRVLTWFGKQLND